jgi:ubiquinone/menaquinone biosynthesis C-methylase UbiE
MSDLQFRETAAAGYDAAVGHWTRRLLPGLLRSARLAAGQRVLDVAAGTGLASQAAIEVVGSTGHVVAADVSPAMLELARERLGHLPNATFAVENGGSLSLPADTFDRVICNMGLMYFPNPERGLFEFFRVLRRGGRAALSVYKSPAVYRNTAGQVIVGGILGIIARHVPAKAEAVETFHTLGREQRLAGLFEQAGFEEIEIAPEILRYPLPSFDAYFAPIERGAGSNGQEFTSLPDRIRRAVAEEFRLRAGDGRAPVEVELEISFASGRK